MHCTRAVGIRVLVDGLRKGIGEVDQDGLLRLWHLIEKHFSESELQSLCFRLKIDYEALPGSGKGNKARELVEFCARHVRLPELLRCLRDVRPRVDWPDLFQESNQREVKSGLFLLAELVREKPMVRSAVSDFRKEFESARQMIEMISYYKRLHDLFQEMEASYNVIVHNDRARLPQDEAAWDSLIANHYILREPVAALLRTAHPLHSDVHTEYWLKLMRKGQRAMQEAIEERNLERLDRALLFLYRALDRGLPRTNIRLVEAAGDLPLNELVEAMRSISRMLDDYAELDSQSVRQFDEATRALAALSGRLDKLIRDHDAWQWIDDELRRIDANLGEDLFELELTWPHLKQVAAELYGEGDEEWAVALRRLGSFLGEMLGDKSPQSIKRIFQSYRSQASRHFRQIDDQLLQMCQNLQEIAGPLDTLLRNLQ